MQDYIVRLVLSTHPGGEHAPKEFERLVATGVSPRAGQALTAAARILALIDGRFAVAVSDVTRVLRPVFRHRILRTFEADSDGIDGDALVGRLLEHVPRVGSD
ncbi:MAG: hypothetical protein AAF152_06995 [Cyanobacteria bacterium P01_A01_bin.114]